MAHVGTKEAADRLGVTQERVTQLIRAGDLKAMKVGRTWIIDERSLTAFERKERRGPGRPKSE